MGRHDASCLERDAVWAMTPVLHGHVFSSTTRLVGAMTAMKILIVALAAFVCGASPAFAELRLTIDNGRVSIVAKDATVRQILTEWARVSQTKIVNVERIPGGHRRVAMMSGTRRSRLRREFRIDRWAA